jgi:glycosyltransferase involved in cell wall biosynthesis
VIIGIVDQSTWEAGRLYSENLARCLLTLPLDRRPIVYWFGGDRPLPKSLDNVARVFISDELKRPQRLFAIAKAARALTVDFLYPYPLGRVARIESAHWIPDFQHLRLPDMFTHRQRQKREFWIRFALRCSSTVVLSSQAAREDLISLAPNSRKPRIEILHFATPFKASDIDNTSRESHAILDKLPDVFAYLPNQMWKHKDHPTALRALSLLREQGLIVPLAMTGDPFDPRDPGWSGHVAALAAELNLTDQLLFLGRLPRAIQLGVLRRSAVVVQPSRSEGWSTVVEDCRALGKSAMVSNIPTHLEQALPGAKYFNPGDAEALAQGIYEQLSTNVSPAPLPALEKASHMRAQDIGQRLMDIATQVAQG